MIDPPVAAAMRDAIARVLSGRETIPPDLPMPHTIREYALAAILPDLPPSAAEFTPAGRRVARATRQVYLAGYLVGREGDQQIGAQLRGWFRCPDAAAAAERPHPYIGLAVCLVCDQPASHTTHRPPPGAPGWIPPHHPGDTP